MGPIEEALKEKFFPALFGWEEINANFQQIIGHSLKHGGLGITDPQLSEESAYNTSKENSRELLDSLLRGTALNYIGHRSCVCGASVGARKEWNHVEMVELTVQKKLAGGQDRNCSHMATVNGDWLSAVLHRLNGTELS